MNQEKVKVCTLKIIMTKQWVEFGGQQWHFLAINSLLLSKTSLQVWCCSKTISSTGVELILAHLVLLRKHAHLESISSTYLDVSLEQRWRTCGPQSIRNMNNFFTGETWTICFVFNRFHSMTKKLCGPLTQQ